MDICKYFRNQLMIFIDFYSFVSFVYHNFKHNKLILHNFRKSTQHECIFNDTKSIKEAWKSRAKIGNAFHYYRFEIYLIVWWFRKELYKLLSITKKLKLGLVYMKYMHGPYSACGSYYYKKARPRRQSQLYSDIKWSRREFPAILLVLRCTTCKNIENIKWVNWNEKFDINV